MWYEFLMKHLITYRMAMFAIASFLPIPLIALAAVFGGWWVVFALSYITVFTFTLDELVEIASDSAQPEREFPVADRLSIILAVSHFLLLALVVWSISSNPTLGLFGTLGLFFPLGGSLAKSATPMHTS